MQRLAPFPLRLRAKFLPAGLFEQGCAGKTTLRSDNVIQVDIKEPENSLEKQELDGTLVHEAVHAAQFAANAVSTEFDIETEAYMVEHIFTLLKKELKT